MVWGIVAGSLLLMSLQVAVPAYELGPHPPAAAAISVTDGEAFIRCAQPVIVTFTTAGVAATAELAGSNGRHSSDRPGEALAYDHRTPRVSCGCRTSVVGAVALPVVPRSPGWSWSRSR